MTGRGLFRRAAGSPLFWALLFSLLFRPFYFRLLAPFTLCPDSPTYLSPGADILRGKIDILRTPLYPLLIRFLALFGGQAGLYPRIAAFQDLAQFVSIVFFYLTAKMLLRSKWAAGAAALCYGCLPGILNYTRVVLTESLSISLAAIFFYCVVRFLRRPGTASAVLAGVLCFLLIMLRPSFLLFLPVLLVFWALRFFFRREERKECLTGFGAALACLALTAAYCAGNFVQNGFFGLSRVSTDNTLYKTIEWGFYRSGGDPAVVRFLSETLRTRAPGSAQVLAMRKFGAARMTRFANAAVKKNGIAYAARSFGAARALFAAPLFTSAAAPRAGREAFLRAFGAACGLSFGVLYLLLAAEMFFLLFTLIRKRRLLWARAGAWCFAAGQLFTVFWGAQNEFARLMAPAAPFVLLLLFLWLEAAVFFTRKTAGARGFRRRC